MDSFLKLLKLLQVLICFVQLPVVIFVFLLVVDWVFAEGPDQPPTRALYLAVALILLNTTKV